MSPSAPGAGCWTTLRASWPGCDGSGGGEPPGPVDALVAARQGALRRLVAELRALLAEHGYVRGAR